MNQLPLLEIKGLKTFYPIKKGILKRTKAYVKAVNDIDITIYEGETLGVVGESGCGKSTLGRTVLGLERKTGGNIRFRDEEIGNLSDSQLKKYKKHMQMIFQDPFASLDPRQRIGDALEEVFIIHTNLSKGLKNF